MEKSIRVLVANHPRLMRESVLTTFADQPDIEIVGEVADESEICESVKKTLPNVVVIALDQPGTRPHICDELLREHPEVRVIAVAADKNCVVTTGLRSRFIQTISRRPKKECLAQCEGILSQRMRIRKLQARPQVKICLTRTK